MSAARYVVRLWPTAMKRLWKWELLDGRGWSNMPGPSLANGSARDPDRAEALARSAAEDYTYKRRAKFQRERERAAAIREIDIEIP